MNLNFPEHTSRKHINAEIRVGFQKIINRIKFSDYATRVFGHQNITVGFPRVLEVITRIGMPIRGHTDSYCVNGHVWEPSGLMLFNTSLSAILHEVAHWQVAEPQYRNLPDYGLGRVDDSIVEGPECIRPGWTKAMCDFEEELAAMLGVLWEIHLDLPGVTNTLVSQGWINVSGTKKHPIFSINDLNMWVSSLTHLYELGFIDNEGVPLLKKLETDDAQISKLFI